MANEENEKKESVKTQISWTVLGGKLIASMPVTNEQLSFDPADLHESWKDFITLYGIKQYVSSNISSESFPLKEKVEELKKAQPDLTHEKAVEAVKATKPAWLKEHVPALRTALWKEMQSLKVEKTKKESAGKETKAQVEERVRATMLANFRAGLEKLGFDEESIRTAMANL